MAYGKGDPIPWQLQGPGWDSYVDPSDPTDGIEEVEYCEDCGGCLCHECGCDLDLDDDRGTGQEERCPAYNCRGCPEAIGCSDYVLEIEEDMVEAPVKKESTSILVIQSWLDNHHLNGGLGAELVVQSWNGGASALIAVGDTVVFEINDGITIEGALIALAEEIKFWCGY